MRTVVCVTTMVLVEHEVDYDDATLKLAAATANVKGETSSENIFSSVISRDSRIVGYAKK